jgi:GMP synthase (glutamine-hydrolysing)
LTAASPRYALLQARNPGDPARTDEHRCFAERLGVDVWHIDAIDVLAGRPDRGALAEADAVLVGGSGDYSVLDDSPAIADFIDAVAWVAESGPPMFASCFGFQALVLGLGGEVIHDEQNAEVGSYDLVLTEDGSLDEIFGALPATFIAQLGHKDRASRLPASLVNLASSVRAPYQAVVVRGRPVYATQFHPEMTWQDNRARFLRYMAQYGGLFGKEAAQRQLDSHRAGPEANQLLARFAARFVAGASPGVQP